MPAECLRGRKEDMTVMQRVAAGVALAVMLSACSSGAPGATAPGVTQQPGATVAVPTPPPVGTVNPQPNVGDLEAGVRALVPPGSSETQFSQVGGNYSLYLTNSTPIDQLEAFWDQAIVAQGLTLAGKFEQAGTLTYSFSNPVGGIVVTQDGSGGQAIVISLGTGQ